MENELYEEKAIKELKERMKLFKEALQDESKRDQFHDTLEGSEILIRLEVFLPSNDDFTDGLYLYIDNSGEIVDADYYYRTNEDEALTRLDDENLKVVRELFEDAFTLEIE